MVFCNGLLLQKKPLWRGGRSTLTCEHHAFRSLLSPAERWKQQRELGASAGPASVGVQVAMGSGDEGLWFLNQREGKEEEEDVDCV